MAQLVNAQVTLVNTMTSENPGQRRVQEKFGVPPERIIDFLTLTGDKVDNVPGVDGCGPKTAINGWPNTAAWTPSSPPPTASKARPKNCAPRCRTLPLSRQLVTIKLDVDLSAHLADGWPACATANRAAKRCWRCTASAGFAPGCASWTPPPASRPRR